MRVRGSPTCLPETLHGARVDLFRDSIKVNEKAQKDLIGCRTILVNAAQIAQYAYCWHILAMESQHTRGMYRKSGSHVRCWHVPVQMLGLSIVCCGDLCEEACNHFNDVRHRHVADLVLRQLGVCIGRTPSSFVGIVRSPLLLGEVLDMLQVLDFYARRLMDLVRAR